MAITSLFYRCLLDWARREEPPCPDDPLQHPDIRQMSARALADLPIGPDVGLKAPPGPTVPMSPPRRCA